MNDWMGNLGETVDIRECKQRSKAWIGFQAVGFRLAVCLIRPACPKKILWLLAASQNHGRKTQGSSSCLEVTSWRLRWSPLTIYRYRVVCSALAAASSKVRIRLALCLDLRSFTKFSEHERFFGWQFYL